MSTGTPDPSDTPGGTPSGAPSSGADTAAGGASGASPGGKPSGKFWAIAAGIAVLVGVGGFFIGSAVKQSDYDKGKSGYNKIYAAGYASGQASGSAAGQKTGQAQGQAQGQKVGQAQGMQIGKKAGIAIGQQQGQAAGYKQGFNAGVPKGANAALGGLTGWNTNVPYVVELNPSPVAGVPYQIYSRTLMVSGTNYFLCPNGKTVCSNTASP